MKRLALILVFASSGLRAEILNLVPGPSTREGVPIAATGKATVHNHQYDVVIAGAGLRKKRVVLQRKVYVGQLLMTLPSNWDRHADAALASLGGQTAVVLRFNFLRNVPASSIAESFRDALRVNHVDLKDPDVDLLLTAVGEAGDALNGGTLTMVLVKRQGGESVALEMAGGEREFVRELDVAAGFTGKIAAIWLGLPADDGVDKLKTELLSGAP